MGRLRLFGVVGAVLVLAVLLPACNPLTNLVDVEAGYGFTCAVRDVGTVACWGRNDKGQLGDGTTTNTENPVDVAGVGNAVAVSAGGRHACALLDDATLHCWGDNGFGQLGDGSLTGVLAVSAGRDHTCALLSGGTVKCFGAG